MKRKLESALEKWESSKNKKPLALFGARQTGKTTSVLAHARAFHDNVVHVDFYKQPQLKAAFRGSLEPRNVVLALEALLRRDIDPEKDFLFLDEIQECDEAITSLKYFCTDMPELHLAAAGSLLGVTVARDGSFPVGYVDMMTMHPMDFEEYCWAMGEERSFRLVRASASDFSPCPVHDRMLEVYRDYLMVGGMPEAVARRAEGGSLGDVRVIQGNIRTAYVADMAKYATNVDAAKIVATWESLPSQLAKESGSTKFNWGVVKSGAKAATYGTAVDWLVAAGIVTKCTQVTDGVSPLKSFENPGSFKLYMADTGLLASAYDALPSDLDTKDNRSARFRGGIAENYVMQQLVASGVRPYYWGSQSSYEVEFVVHGADGVIPVEVKSGRHVKATSATRFLEKYGCPYMVRVSAKDFGSSGDVRSFPLYAASLIEEATGASGHIEED